jgi:hypothetical protein
VSESSLAESGIGWREIGAALERANGRVLVLMDACHAGDLTRDLSVPNDRLVTDLLRGQRGGSLVFAASKGRQYSYEIGTSARRGLTLVADPSADPGSPEQDSGATEEKRVESHGLFTSAILNVLADPTADTNHDGGVDADEFVDAVTKAVGIASEGEQTPWVAERSLLGTFQLYTTSPH